AYATPLEREPIAPRGPGRPGMDVPAAPSCVLLAEDSPEDDSRGDRGEHGATGMRAHVRFEVIPDLGCFVLTQIPRRALHTRDGAFGSHALDARSHRASGKPIRGLVEHVGGALLAGFDGVVRGLLRLR